MAGKKGCGGKPQKNLTTEQIVQVEALAAVLSVEQIADYFGIGKTTFIKVRRAGGALYTHCPLQPVQALCAASKRTEGGL